MSRQQPPLTLAAVRRRYADGETASALVKQLLPAWRASESDAVWISRPQADTIRARAAELDEWPRDCRGPLWGVPFAVKDNIDVAGLPTTAACPQFAYQPRADATVVRRLLGQGAICVGKTNLDQFATGLVGVRSPYGVPCNPFAADRIPGGSSSGSAVAVAAGLVSFALGTDTAGSGRVPPGFPRTLRPQPTPRPLPAPRAGAVAAGRGGYPLASPAPSASSRPAVSCRPPASCPPAGRSTAYRCSRSR